MERPNRKYNRMREYDYGAEGAYFVTVCTQNRAQLFDMELQVKNGWNTVQRLDEGAISEKTNQIIHKWIGKTQNKYPNIVIDTYVVMPDHLHLIITIKEQRAGASLPDVMGFFKTMTTNEYIRGVKEGVLPPFEGKLWQKSYYDHVIRNQRDYIAVWEYIENNPANWLAEHDTM